MPAILKHSKVATRLSRDYPIRGGAHLIRYPTNFQASAIRIRKCGDGVGGEVIWAMDISSKYIYMKKKKLIKISTLLKGDDSDVQ